MWEARPILPQATEKFGRGFAPQWTKHTALRCGAAGTELAPIRCMNIKAIWLLPKVVGFGVARIALEDSVRRLKY
jgi:hypothetical protein